MMIFDTEAAKRCEATIDADVERLLSAPIVSVEAHRLITVASNANPDVSLAEFEAYYEKMAQDVRDERKRQQDEFNSGWAGSF